ncbi:MAG: hypothetical protein MUP11_08750 [Anaerolineales bacterium]|nr:hypothetical protein [Anaerolineales bacterium]
MKMIFIKEKDRHLGYFITTIGSGLGWITIFGGYFASDFWVAEAYPFLSMYTNPHFSIGLALMILAIIPGKKIPIYRDILLGAAIALVQPFGVVIVFVVRGAFEVVKIIEKQFSLKNWVSSDRFYSLLAFGIGGGSILVYQYVSILTDPVLSAWNQQNITTSPEIFDLIISFAPCLILAGFGIKAAWQNEEGKFLVIWAAASLMLIYFPWNLQRRFLTGIYIPLAALSVFGLNSLGKRFGSVSRWGTIILAGLVLPTNCIILFSGIRAASIQDPNIYISDGIINGLNWIEKNSEKDALILTDEETGLFIPSFTGRRVIYGHPFETINADDELFLVESFFDGSLDPEEYSKILAGRNVGYIFLRRPAVQQLSEWIRQNELVPVFDYQDYKIYAVGRK